MIDVHKNMPISMRHFDIVWQHTENVFKQLKVNDELISDAKQRIYTLTGQIVNTK